MDDIETLRAKVIALGKANDDRQELLESISGKNKELKDALDAAKAIGEKAIRDRDKALEDLAQMKSTLVDTRHTLRAVKEDRDEFAAKMNDAVERAERLESELSDTKRQYEWSRLERDRMERNGQFERGLINALQFALLCVTGNTERVNGIDWLWNEDSLNFKDNV